MITNLNSIKFSTHNYECSQSMSNVHGFQYLIKTMYFAFICLFKMTIQSISERCACLCSFESTEVDWSHKNTTTTVQLDIQNWEKGGKAYKKLNKSFKSEYEVLGD